MNVIERAAASTKIVVAAAKKKGYFVGSVRCLVG